jgi:hypothetical protein
MGMVTGSGTNTAITDKISSVQDLESGLANYGSMTEGVLYFGPAVALLQNGSYVSALRAGN